MQERASTTNFSLDFPGQTICVIRRQLTKMATKIHYSSWINPKSLIMASNMFSSDIFWPKLFHFFLYHQNVWGLKSYFIEESFTNVHTTRQRPRNQNQIPLDSMSFLELLYLSVTNTHTQGTEAHKIA